MEIKILYMGDISGTVGIEACKINIQKIKEKNNIDLTVANAENASHHFGFTNHEYDKLKKCGIDKFTLGNHAFDKTEIFDIVNNKDIAIPLNWSPKYIKGNRIIETVIKGQKIIIVNILANLFMPFPVNNYFEIFDEFLDKNNADIYLVDFHGESSGEKYSFAYCYNGKINGVLGTHTHIQTVDNRVLPINEDIKKPKQTLYISDIGMCGPYNSVIGCMPKETIFKGKTNIRTRLIPAKMPYQFCAVILTIDLNNKNSSIERIYINPDSPNYKEKND